MEVITTGCIVAPKGFQAGTTYCGIKTIKDSLDLGIIFFRMSGDWCSLIYYKSNLCSAGKTEQKGLPKRSLYELLLLTVVMPMPAQENRGYKDAGKWYGLPESV